MGLSDTVSETFEEDIVDKDNKTYEEAKESLSVDFITL